MIASNYGLREGGDRDNNQVAPCRDDESVYESSTIIKVVFRIFLEMCNRCLKMSNFGSVFALDLPKLRLSVFQNFKCGWKKRLPFIRKQFDRVLKDEQLPSCSEPPMQASMALIVWLMHQLARQNATDLTLNLALVEKGIISITLMSIRGQIELLNWDSKVTSVYLCQVL